MVYEQRQQAALGEIVAWLEDEFREIKLQLSRLGQGVDQATVQSLDLATQVHEAQDGIAATANQLEDIPRLAAQLSQLRSQLVRTEEQTTALERRVAEELVPIQSESERMRQETNTMVRRLDLIERAVASWSGRFELLEEANRRVHELTTLLRQRHEELERRQVETETRASRSIEAHKHHESELGRLVSDLRNVQERNATFDDHAQIVAGTMKRLQQQVEAVHSEVEAQREVFEKLDLLRAELRRLEERTGSDDQLHRDYQARFEEHAHVLAALDGKDKGFSERLEALQDELRAQRSSVAEQLHRVHELLERQKRRQLEELERDLRDLKQAMPKGPEARLND
jgi:chromosome segregation ATPase